MKTAISLLALGLLLYGCSPEQSDPAPDTSVSVSPAAAGALTADPATGAASGEPATAAAARRARYTRLDKCRVIEATSDEGGWYSAECPGEGGYKLRHTEGDLRQNLVVVPPQGEEVSLALAEATQRGGFSRLGDAIEWRGRNRGGEFRPDALILRYNVVEAPEAPGKETSYLLTVALDGGEPCVTAMVPPGPTQNERARRIADGPMQCQR